MLEYQGPHLGPDVGADARYGPTQSMGSRQVLVQSNRMQRERERKSRKCVGAGACHVAAALVAAGAVPAARMQQY